jgi:hypothetical protein
MRRTLIALALGHSLVVERLSVTPHQVELHAMLAGCFRYGLRIQFPEKKIQPSQISDSRRVGVHHSQNCVADPSRERILVVGKEGVARASPPARPQSADNQRRQECARYTMFYALFRNSAPSGGNVNRNE